MGFQILKIYLKAFKTPTREPLEVELEEGAGLVFLIFETVFSLAEGPLQCSPAQ
jgi:hypothetical protein